MNFHRAISRYIIIAFISLRAPALHAAGDCTRALTVAWPRHAQETDFTCGAACLRSFIHHVRGVDFGESYFAQALGTYVRGFTTSSALQAQLLSFGFASEIRTGLGFSDLSGALARGEFVILGWMSEGTPHK